MPEWPSFIGEDTAPEDPERLIRAVLTCFWGQTEGLRIRGGGPGIFESDEFNNALKAADLLYQVTGRSIDDIAAMCVSPYEAFGYVRQWLSIPALERSKSQLTEACLSAFRPEMGNLLAELLSAIDISAGRFTQTVIERVDAGAFGDHEAGILSNYEVARITLDALHLSLAPLVPQVCDLTLRREPGSLVVERRGPPVIDAGRTISHCDRLAGRSVGLAYVLGPKLDGGGEYELPPAELGAIIHMRDEKIRIWAACMANFMAADREAHPLVGRLTSFLKAWTDIRERTEILSRLAEATVLAHEIGHLDTFERIVSASRQIRNNEGQKEAYLAKAMELCAELEVIKRVQSRDDDLMRDFLLLWHVSMLGFDGMIVKERHPSGYQREQFLFIRALLDDDPVSYLSGIIENMRNALASSSINTYISWELHANAEAWNFVCENLWRDAWLDTGF